MKPTSLDRPREGDFFAIRFYGCYDRKIKKYIVHCLELDLVADGASREEAESNLTDIIQAHLDFAMENDNWDNVFHPAPPDVWAKFAKLALRGGKSIQADRTEHPTRTTPPLEFQSVYA